MGDPFSNYDDWKLMSDYDHYESIYGSICEECEKPHDECECEEE